MALSLQFTFCGNFNKLNVRSIYSAGSQKTNMTIMRAFQGDSQKHKLLRKC